MRYLVWFSCGAASAIAAKLAIEKHGKENVVVLYCDTMQAEHPDNLRFFKEIERWLDCPIAVISSAKYETIDQVFEKTRYMAGIAGARCTTEMKKVPRLEFQRPNDIHIFGYTAEEVKRAETFEKYNPELFVEWILIDEEVSKDQCLSLLAEEGIKLPEMYALGFEHNNCLGCVKSASTGYWNKIRKLFPEVFEKRCIQSRNIGAKLIRIKNVRRYLDELPTDDNDPDDDIDCGPVCQIPKEEA